MNQRSSRDFPVAHDESNRCTCCCHDPGKIIMHDRCCCEICWECGEKQILDLTRHQHRAPTEVSDVTK